MPGSLIFAVRTMRWLRHLVSELRPSALLVQDALDLSIPGVMAVRGTSTKLAVMDHGRLTNVLDRRWQRMVRRRLGPVRGAVFGIAFALDTPWRVARWRLALSRADAGWYVGYEASKYFAHAGARAHRYAQLLPSGFGPPTVEQRRVARAAFGLDEGAVAMNMVTRLEGEKSLDAVLQALEPALSESETLQLLIGGGGSLRAWLDDQLVRRRIDSRVALLGELSRAEVHRLHHASDFHLYAGVIGCGMSVALLEAMSCGVVPIVSDVPAEHRELVGDAGWVFPAGDLSALTTALAQALATPPEQLAQLRQAVTERVASYSDHSLRALIVELIDSHS
jgi:glycosyltransferase involved in cell wall biosynthesis